MAALLLALLVVVNLEADPSEMGLAFVAADFRVEGTLGPTNLDR